MTSLQRYYGLKGQLGDFKLKDKYLRGGDTYDLKEILDYVTGVAIDWGYDVKTMLPLYELTMEKGGFVVVGLLRLYDQDDLTTIIDIRMTIDDITRFDGATLTIVRTNISSNDGE